MAYRDLYMLSDDDVALLISGLNALATTPSILDTSALRACALATNLHSRALRAPINDGDLRIALAGDMPPQHERMLTRDRILETLQLLRK